MNALSPKLARTFLAKYSFCPPEPLDATLILVFWSKQTKQTSKRCLRWKLQVLNRSRNLFCSRMFGWSVMQDYIKNNLYLEVGVIWDL